MTWIVVDIEADGPIPGDYSMISLGAVVVEPEVKKFFYGELHPISDKWIPEALAVSGFSREQTTKFDKPEVVMHNFKTWLTEVSLKKRPLFIADNNGFDWMFVCWYFHHFLNENPFGHSSANLGSLYKGLIGDMSQNFKHLRRTKHTHNPVDDARGNAEAMIHMVEKLGLKLKNKW